MSKRKISLASESCFGSEPNVSLQPSSTYIPSQKMKPCKRVKVEDEITGQDYGEDICEDEFLRFIRCENEIEKLKAHYSHAFATEPLHEVKWFKSKMNNNVMEQVQSHLENDNKYLQTKIVNLTKLIQDSKSAFNQRIFQLKSINMIPFDYSIELNQSTSIESMMSINQLIESIKPNQSAIPYPNDILNINPSDILNPSEIINPSDINLCDIQVFTTETQTINEIYNPCDIQYPSDINPCDIQYPNDINPCDIQYPSDINPCDMTCDTQVCTTSAQTINETQSIQFEQQQHSSQSDDDSNDLIGFNYIFHSEYHQ